MYPAESSVRSRPSLVVSGERGTLSESRFQIIFVMGLDRNVIGPPHVCCRVEGDVRSCLGNSGSLGVVIVSGRGAT